MVVVVSRTEVVMCVRVRACERRRDEEEWVEKTRGKEVVRLRKWSRVVMEQERIISKIREFRFMSSQGTVVTADGGYRGRWLQGTVVIYCSFDYDAWGLMGVLY